MDVFLRTIQYAEAAFHVRTHLATPDNAGFSFVESVNKTHALVLFKSAILMPQTESAVADLNHFARYFAGILQHKFSRAVNLRPRMSPAILFHLIPNRFQHVCGLLLYRLPSTLALFGIALQFEDHYGRFTPAFRYD